MPTATPTKPAAPKAARRNGKRPARPKALVGDLPEQTPAQPAAEAATAAPAAVEAKAPPKRKAAPAKAAKRPARRKAAAAKAATKARRQRAPQPPRVKSKMSFHDAAVRVLREADSPLSVREITTRATKARYLRSAGKTPSATMATIILRGRTVFVKVAPGTFDLREVNPRGNKSRPAAK